MSEEKMKVLEMLKNGQITTDEALKLLQQLPDTKERVQRKDNGPRENSTLIDDIAQVFNDGMQSFSELVINQNLFDIGHTSHKFLESENIPQYIESLSLAAKNAKLNIVGYSGKSIQIDISYKTKHDGKVDFALEELNGHYSLVYNTSSLRSVSLDVKIPEVGLGHLMAENKNAKIEIDNIRPVKADIITKNAAINVHRLYGKTILLETKNAGISVNDSEIEDITAKTTNARISLDSVTGNKSRIITTNAAIKANECDISELSLKTTNATVKAHCLYNNHSFYSISIYSSNANMSVALPGNSYGYKINASTSMGEVKTELSNLVINSMSKTLLDASSIDFEQFRQKILLDINTTNGSIKIY